MRQRPTRAVAPYSHRGKGLGRTALAAVALLLVTCYVVDRVLNSEQNRTDLRRQPHASGQVRHLLGFQESTADDGRQFLQAIPRRTWSMQDVSSEFCAWDSASSSCQWFDYAQSVSWVVVPSLATGIVFTLIFGIVFCARCCCLSRRCCLIPYRFRIAERLVLAMGLVIVCLFILGAVGVGALGAVWSHQGVDDTSSGAASFGDTVVNITEQAAAVLVEIDSSYSQQMNDSIATAHDVQDTLDNILNFLEKAELGRFILFIGFYAAIVTVVLYSFVVLFFFRSFLFIINYWYALLLFVVIVLLLTVCVGVGTVVSDVCDAFDQPDNTTDIFTEFIGSAWGNCSALAEVVSPLVDEYNQSVTEGCDYYDKYCSDPSCGLSNCVACNITTNKTEILQSTVTEVLYCGTSSEQYCPSNTICSTCSSCACYNQSQTVEVCATSCLDPSYRNFSSQLVNYTDLMIELGSTIELVLPYAGCQIIARMIEFLDEPLCVEFLSGDFLIVLSGISLCLMWLFYHSLLLLSMEWAKSYKRVRQSYY